MHPVTDIIGREIKVDDFVAFYSNVYQVKALGHAGKSGNALVKIMIMDPGTTSRPQNKYSKDMAVLDKNDVLVWLLKRNA